MVVKLYFDNRERRGATWQEVTDMLSELKLGHGHALFLEDSGGSELNAVYVQNLGFYITTQSATERERVASDRALSLDRIRVVIADEQEVPRSILVGDELAHSVIREFFETGSRSSAAEWLDPYEAIT